MQTTWESELAGFLTRLSAAQDESLEILSKKRELLVAADTQGLADVQAREQALIERLQECLRQREDLLRR
ncbi:MAG: hypothetical protein ACYTG0_44925, partial [Planctomycetota bacterium]